MEITLKPTEDFKDEFKADIEKSTCEICFKHKSQYLLLDYLNVGRHGGSE